MKTKIKTIDVHAKEWFDRTYGNSYFSMNITINYGLKSAQTFFVPLQYGYGNHYEHMAFKFVQDNGIIQKQENNVAPWHYYQDNGIIYRATKRENCLKRELKY